MAGMLFSGLPLSASAVSQAERRLSYTQYAKAHEARPFAGEVIELQAAAAGSSAVKPEEHAGRQALLLQENTAVQWDFAVPQSGRYQLTLEYCPLEGKGVDPEISFQIDGSYPFREAQRVFLSRIWRDIRPGGAARFDTDNRGNELVPKQEEVFRYQKERLQDKQGSADEAFAVYLEAGAHTLLLRAEREGIAVTEITLSAPEELKAYADTDQSWPDKAPADFRVTLEAELPEEKSDAGIYPIGDKSSPAISPADPSKTVLNTIGGSSWKFQGQWISWVFDIPEDGYYQFSFVYKQDLVRGLPAVRQMVIDDGRSGFRELARLEFPYGTDWQRMTPSDPEGKPYRVYLEKGRHTLRLEVRLGDIAQAVRTTDSSVASLNELYRRIVMVTGTAPDQYRDYYLDTEIPDLLPEFQRIADELEKEAGLLEERFGAEGGESAFFYEVVRQLRSFIKEPETIPVRLENFKTNIGALAQTLLTMREQPLQLDTITISAAGLTEPPVKASLWDKLVFRLRVFLASFIGDYSNIGNVYEGTAEPLKVWVSVNDLQTTGISSGRDQAEILKRLIDDSFTPDQDLPVNLALVSGTDTLMQAILAKNGPDCALFVPEATVVNLAMRNALADLTQLGTDAFFERFYPSAYYGFTHLDSVYAAPETQNYNMMFYRTDIFAELGLKAPQTWDEFYDVTARLQKKNMQVGIPENQSIFEMLLLQNGGDIYNADRSATRLTEPAAIEAFQIWTDLYVQYNLPLQFDFFNRFRTGEMPLGITSFTFYNQLSVAAPEISNSWAMVPVPGMLRDGEINRAQSCLTTGAIIIRQSERRQDAWRFIDWWTSGAAQKRFGKELETVLGTAARYNTANKEAFSGLAWSREEYQALSEQWEQVTDIAPTPASYYVTRCLTNAFRRAVYHNANTRETLNRYAKDMDKELLRKRQEFGLEEAK